MDKPLFPYLAQQGKAAVDSIASLSASDEERAENRRVLQQVLAQQNGYLNAGQRTAYFPGEILDYAAYHPEHALPYTVSLLILLQSAIVYRWQSVELAMCYERYQCEHIGHRLPESMRQALDEAFAAAKEQGVV